jgi:hypothetical protein
MSLQQISNETEASTQHERMSHFKEITAQHFEALRLQMDSIVPTLRRVMESQTDKQTVAQEKEIEELRKVITTTNETNKSIFSTVLNIQRSLPPQVERQQPVHFVDACGRHAPFHLEFINSWDAFEAVLQVRFKDKGLPKILRREYVLERAGNKRTLNRNTSWERSVLPGLTINMDMLFNIPRENTNSCLGCNYESPEPMDAVVDW